MAALQIDQAEHADDLEWRWHDNLIYGLTFDIGDPETQEWRSDLILDIDFIVEWLREPTNEFRFRVAPATLTFHDVGDVALPIIIFAGSALLAFAFMSVFQSWCLSRETAYGFAGDFAVHERNRWKCRRIAGG